VEIYTPGRTLAAQCLPLSHSGKIGIGRGGRKHKTTAAYFACAPRSRSICPISAFKLLAVAVRATTQSGLARRPYLGVASSPAHRLLAMLTYRGFVRQDPVSRCYLPLSVANQRGFCVYFCRIGISPLSPSPTSLLWSPQRASRGVDSLGCLDGASVPFLGRRVEGPGCVPGASLFGRTMPAVIAPRRGNQLARLSQPELRQLIARRHGASSNLSRDRQP